MLAAILLTKVMTMKPDGRAWGGGCGGRGREGENFSLWTADGGWRMKEEEEAAGRDNRPSGISTPAVELSFLMRPPRPAV